MAPAHSPAVHLDLRCELGAAESVRRELDRLQTTVSSGELSALRRIVRTLVAAVLPDGATTISLELWAAEHAVHLRARYRRERVTDEPPDLHPGALALIERCAPRWAAERTVSETVLRAELDRGRLGAVALPQRSSASSGHGNGNTSR
ncbi:MAG: hypothetical protein GEU88_03590 [Solirubrobacterales bacterium]|nr:hypothetical protein [Solirubrobacterales bacterium]